MVVMFAVEGASPMARLRRKWSELSPRARRTIIVVGTIEGMLKVSALVSLARRPAGAVRGSRALWATSIVLLNSAGVVPLAYFVFGRRDRT
jgi:hypothetical protein